MASESRFTADINALRYELLGYSDSASGALQYACRRYQGILHKMGDSEGSKPFIRDMTERVSRICDGVDRAMLFNNDRTRTETALKLLTELRMLIDMHLHVMAGNETA